jgi:hypothetical protein
MECFLNPKFNQIKNLTVRRMNCLITVNIKNMPLKTYLIKQQVLANKPILV